MDDLVTVLKEDNLRMESVIQRVRELHLCDVDAFCSNCNFNYPCPTIKALDGEQ